jgi:hypothetical protein
MGNQTLYTRQNAPVVPQGAPQRLEIRRSITTPRQTYFQLQSDSDVESGSTGLKELH